jgi:hypothetical protein
MSDKCDLCDKPALPTPWRIYWQWDAERVTSQDYAVCSERCGKLLMDALPLMTGATALGNDQAKDV